MSAAPSSAPAASPTPSSAPTPAASTPASAPATNSADSKPGVTPAGSSATKPAGTTDQTPPDKAAAAAKAEAVRRHKLKVNGQEMELEEPEVLRRAQLAEAAEQKFQEAARNRKEIAQVLELMKNNPLEGLKRLGINPREFSEKYLAGELQREMMTPEQRELQELREFREKQTKAQQEAEMQAAEQAKQAQVAQQQQRAAAEYDKQISDVLTATNLPRSPETVKRVASVLRSALAKGYELDVPTAVDMVKQNYMTEVQALFGGLKGEALAKMLGDGLLKEVRKYDLAQLKSKLAPPPADPTPQPAARSRESEKPRGMTPDEWRAELYRKAGITE